MTDSTIIDFRSIMWRPHSASQSRSVASTAAVHDVLRVCDAINEESNAFGKSDLKRIVSMLTRLIQRTETVAEERIEYEYEYEYRDAEYEYEPNHQPLTPRRTKGATHVFAFAEPDQSALFCEICGFLFG